MGESPETLKLLDSTVREHSRLVNEEIARRLPRTGHTGPLAASLREYLDLGGRRLRPSFAVFEPMRHVVSSGGKRVRPMLCLLACEAVGGKPDHALPTAAGIEFLHTFTLVHDDIMDKALTRRNRPTVGALWGDDLAILVGDGLFALAFRAFAESADVPGVDPARVVRVLRRASETSLDLAQGQAMDLLFAHRRDVTVEEHLEMIRLKTGVLLEFSLEAGAILGGGGEREIRAIRRIGAPLGMAFQLRDDLLDVTGSPRVTGKPAGGDIRTGKRTLLVAHAARRSPRSAELFEILDRSAGETTDEDVARAISILREAGSLDHATATAERYLAEARAALADLPHTPGGRALERLAALADYILHRDA